MRSRTRAMRKRPTTMQPAERWRAGQNRQRPQGAKILPLDCAQVPAEVQAEHEAHVMEPRRWAQVRAEAEVGIRSAPEIRLGLVLGDVLGLFAVGPEPCPD